MNNIYLIGFMGCGKSTLARNLAEAFNMHCMDLDQLIEEKAGQSIRELFDEKGEDYFRDLETFYLKETSQCKNTVVSTGGGAVGRAVNRQFLKAQRTFYLDWPFEVLYKRIAGDQNRPLSKSYEQLFALYQSRRAFYEASAMYTITCQDETPYLLVQKIIKILKEK